MKGTPLKSHKLIWITFVSLLAHTNVGLTDEVPTYQTNYDIQTKVVLSKPYFINQKYKSMKGPQSTQKIYLIESDTPELLWVTGYVAVMKSGDGLDPMSQEFMCHSSLDFNPSSHRENPHQSNYGDERLFTLSRGQFSIQFPKGFAIPVVSDQPLSLTTQVLNLNIENQSIEVRHEVKINFVRDRDTKIPFRPLFTSGAFGLKLLEGQDGHFGVKSSDEKPHGPRCLPGLNASEHTLKDPQARIFTGHWVVKPSREENHTRVTTIMNIPFDTTIHYIAVHLHPFAESLELVDLTEEKTLFKSHARNASAKIGLEHVDYLSSDEGIPVYPDHEYEIVSVYNNTSSEDQDSMAVLYLYLLDKYPSIPNFSVNEKSR